MSLPFSTNETMTFGPATVESMKSFCDGQKKDLPWQTLVEYNNAHRPPLDEKKLRRIFDKHQAYNLITTSKGLIVCNEENVYRTMNGDDRLHDCFRMNTFNGNMETNFQKKYFDTIQRSDVVRVQMYLMKTYEYLIKVGHSAVEDCMTHIAEDHKVSPPVEYIHSIAWDKTPRLDSWLTQTYNVPDDVYHRAVGSNWIKGMVKRLIYPGCKFDYVLVLEGKQGIKKSTSLAILGGEWHVETILAPDNKDFFMLFSGKAIVEFSEGETLSRSDTKRLKAIITMPFDKYRAPYERAPKEFPRQCVFAMTTNQSEYLKDETGNRRWLPVECIGQVNTDWLAENRDQLLAEAYYRVIVNKETVWEFPIEETEAAQRSRQITDPRDEQVYDWYFTKLGERDRIDGITTRMAFVDALHGGHTFTKDMDRLDEMIIGSIFRDTLKLEPRRTMQNGTRFNRYFMSEQTKKLAPHSMTLISMDEVFEKF